MPSPIPSPLYGGPPTTAVQQPGATTQFGCVYCLKDGEYAPLTVVYHVGGYSMCLKHAKDAMTPQN